MDVRVLKCAIVVNRVAKKKKCPLYTNIRYAYTECETLDKRTGRDYNTKQSV